MVPWVVLAAFAVVGLVVGGTTGLFVGVLLGVAFNLALGALVRRVQGGILPKGARRAVSVSLLMQCPDIAQAAFPGIEGDALMRHVDKSIETVARRAISLSPSPSNDVAFSAPVMLAAAHAVEAEQTTDATRQLYAAIGIIMTQEWYLKGPP